MSTLDKNIKLEWNIKGAVKKLKLIPKSTSNSALSITIPPSGNSKLGSLSL